jgi:hypothetical protein
MKGVVIPPGFMVKAFNTGGDENRITAANCVLSKKLAGLMEFSNDSFEDIMMFH